MIDSQLVETNRYSFLQRTLEFVHRIFFCILSYLFRYLCS